MVLSRRKDESIYITVPGLENRIEVTVIELRGDKIRLGFAADPEVTIHRAEIQAEVDRRARENGEGGTQ